MTQHPKRSTIQNRMIKLNFLIFGFIGFLVVAYSFQFFLLEKNLVMLEEFHDLFDNVLEVRRYEKNYLLDVGSENITIILEYLDKIQAEIKRQEKNIISVTGEGAYARFLNDLYGYTETFSASRTLGVGLVIDPKSVRQQGKEMAEFTRQLLDEKQRKIRNTFKLTFISFVVITGAIFHFIITGLYLQSKRVLKRISFVQQATKNVVAGNFKPITCNDTHEDEITDLINAFNAMASELDNRQELLIQSRKLAAIGTFSSGIAHELNNPLNNISLSADTLLEEFSTLEEDEAKEILTDIITQTDRATGVVKNLLDFSRDKAPTAESLNIKEVLAFTKRLVANELRLKAIWLEDYVPDNLPLIKGDMQKLQQVFLNLFVNSIHVMPEGGLIYLDAAEAPPGYIRINVNDTGCGIPPESLDQIFDPFYTTKAVGQGTGLGLSIVYGIVKKHGGYIEVKSKINVGSTFSVYLPVLEETKPEAGEDNASRGS